MTAYSIERYERMVLDTFKKIEELARLKGGEYSGDTDRLANFRRNGEALGVPMELVWAIYANKHHDALMQYIRDIVSGKTRERMEGIDGRIDDLIVYLLLFKAMVEERAAPVAAVVTEDDGGLWQLHHSSDPAPHGRVDVQWIDGGQTDDRDSQNIGWDRVAFWRPHHA